MKRLEVILLFWLFISHSTADCVATEWKGIVPLKSTRTDVERLFPKPNGPERYIVAEGTAYIYFSDGNCVPILDEWKESTCACLAPKDTVLNIVLTLSHGIRWYRSKIRHDAFERYQFHEDLMMSTFADFSAGIIYTVDESRDLITEIEYLPSLADCHLVLNSARSWSRLMLK